MCSHLLWKWLLKKLTCISKGLFDNLGCTSVRNYSDLLYYQTVSQIPVWREYSFFLWNKKSYKMTSMSLFFPSPLCSTWVREHFLQMELCWPQQAMMVLSNSGRSILKGKTSQGNWRIRKWRILEQRPAFSLRISLLQNYLWWWFSGRHKEIECMFVK